jgi:hypothetical protein
MFDTTSIIRVSKVDAAKRQLQSAITLWFKDEDPVSVHTLVFAAYEVFHSVSKKRNPNRRDLLFDTLWIKDEYRKDWYKIIKKPAYFFKHADRDPDGVLDFYPDMNEWFILYATAAREFCAEHATQEELDFMSWFFFNRTEQLTEGGRQMFTDALPPNVIEYGRGLSKREFFEKLREARLLITGRRYPLNEL